MAEPIKMNLELDSFKDGFEYMKEVLEDMEKTMKDISEYNYIDSDTINELIANAKHLRNICYNKSKLCSSLKKRKKAYD